MYSTSSLKRKSLRYQYFLWVILLLLAACSRTNEPPNSDEAPSPLPPEVNVENTPLPTEEFEPAPTPSPEVSPSPTSIDLSIPLYTHMGIELVGSNFIEKIPLAAEAGAGWVRMNGVFWAQIEPTEGARNWETAADFEVRAQAISEAGMKLIAIVRRTPEWAQAVPGYYCGPVLPDKLQAFGMFLHDLVARYSQPPFNVKYWELGNEPDIAPTISPPDQVFGCWGDETDPYYGGGYYAEMLNAAYPQIKAADPDAQVLVGGLLLDCNPIDPPIQASGESKDCTPSRFLEGILLNGGGDYFDGVSFHAYDFYSPEANIFGNLSWQGSSEQFNQVPASLAKANYLRALLALYGYENKFLINTETALLCGRGQDDPECTEETFEIAKANYVAMSYTVAKAENFRANVWYHYQKGWRFSGLTSSDLQPHPALTAYRFASQVFEGAFLRETIKDYDNLFGYKFLKSSTEGEIEIWVVWSLDGNAFSVTLPDEPVTVYNVFGEEMPPSQILEVGASPLYLQWMP